MPNHFNFQSLATLLSITSLAAAASTCDYYAAGGTPCVAAHSTTRCLYYQYDGPLYQVRRSSDNTTKDIGPLKAGGPANSHAQDLFCRRTYCAITTIYDQSGNGNNLTPAPPGGAANGTGPNNYDLPVNASMAPIYLANHKAYGVYITPGMGYRNDNTTGVATGNDPEGMYAVLDGTHYNGGCCFDYGNAETNNTDNGAGTMETIYFGLGTGYGTGNGTGPWILSDMENGLYSKGSVGVNPHDPTITERFISAFVKGQSRNFWSLRGGNAQKGPVKTFYAGKRPSGYFPMRKEGAIILGIGGDNSNFAEGTFYEGALTSGYPSAAVEAKVQQAIIMAHYRTTPVGSQVSTV